MRIQIVSAGKLKESWLKQAAAEYTRRLSRYTQVELLEVADEPASENLSEAQRLQVLEREGDRILKCLSGKSMVIALCIEGKQYHSEKFAEQLQIWLKEGGSAVTFIIGGSLGLSDAVRERADGCMSLSTMTFPHQFAKIVLLEQLYRAFKIDRNEPYHK